MGKTKYLVSLFDGTTQDWNRDEHKDWSNIVRLHTLLHSSPPKDGELLDMYGDGVGCRVNEKLFGSLSGRGLERRIEETYYDIGSWTMKARTDGLVLRIYVFGFSRGAYAARLFCRLIDYCGVPGNAGSYQEAFRRLQELDASGVATSIADGSYLACPAIEMLGVFDTVKMTGIGSGIDISKLPSKVRSAFHAMSYNERRSIFPLTRFAPGQPGVEEVWFVGSHTDIGGGYVKRGLADRSLEWMIEKATEHGLDIKFGDVPNDTASHEEEFNDSFSCLQAIGGCLLGKGWSKKRKSLHGDYFHWSVQGLRGKFAGKIPPLPGENVIAYLPRSEHRVVV